jgi:predicted phage tail protein
MHKKSLLDPTMKGELTGKKFLDFNIPLDIVMDLWYIDSTDIGINDKQSSRSIEQLIQKHLKPKAWTIR